MVRKEFKNQVTLTTVRLFGSDSTRQNKAACCCSLREVESPAIVLEQHIDHLLVNISWDIQISMQSGKIPSTVPFTADKKINARALH
jgi:hypothetical protein